MYVQIINDVGQPRIIHTSDPEMLAKWIVESLAQLTTGYPDEQFRVKIDAIWIQDGHGNSKPDWNANVAQSFYDSIPGGIGSINALIEALKKYREQVNASAD